MLYPGAEPRMHPPEQSALSMCDFHVALMSLRQQAEVEAQIPKNTLSVTRLIVGEMPHSHSPMRTNHTDNIGNCVAKEAGLMLKNKKQVTEQPVDL